MSIEQETNVSPASPSVSLSRHSVVFTAPRSVEIHTGSMPRPGNGEVLIRTEASLISPGTELLVYRGQAPSELPVDAKLPAFEGERFTYPLKYGYACVGRVADLGANVDARWLNRTVFTFHPHESAFTAKLEELVPLPDDVSVDDALFLPLMETAVTLVQDGVPRLGEAALVTGLGVVGLLTTALLARMGVDELYTLDLYENRRERSLALGAKASVDPSDDEQLARLRSGIHDHGSGADVTFELSGSPQGLNEALELTAETGRVVIGSWYGTKSSEIKLGGRFHRSRIRMLASQVSTIDPELRGRWTVERRQALAWRLIHELKPSRLLTHHLPLGEAAHAYELLDGSPERTLAVAFRHPVE